MVNKDFFPQKLDHLTDILITDPIFPAELFISLS